jgi:hypothetical protein
MINETRRATKARKPSTLTDPRDAYGMKSSTHDGLATAAGHPHRECTRGCPVYHS